ncbi:ABC transporter ATP-binding protein [Streptomyces cadmiisoli]|uniref:ABC transporter ATP-binding protein n=2 Tax=Streptomyces cadmiisoli TaxID=2184053 RepID=A0A2Z4IS43_9ACTN|nr:ABC transporter ATP-binding protein [Streptomyces cadmiisoli]
MRVLATDRRIVISLLLWTAVTSMPALASGYLISRAVDDGFLAHAPWTGAAWLSGLVVTLLIQAGAEQHVVRAQSRLAEALRERLTRDVVVSVIATSTENGWSPPRYEAAAALTSQVESVRRMTGALLSAGLTASVTLAASIVGVACTAPPTLPLVLPAIAAGLLLLRWQSAPLAAVHHNMVVANERISHRTGQVLHAIRDIVAEDATQRAVADVREAIDRHSILATQVARSGIARGLTTAIGGYLPLVLLIGTAPRLLESSLLSPGALVGAAIYTANGCIPALLTLSRTAAGIAAPLSAALRRLAEHRTTHPRTYAPGTALPKTGTLRAVDVTFRHDDDAAPLVSGVNLTVAPGAHLAVVGPSGAGKSTLAFLLAGLLTPTSGHVAWAGVPLTAADQEDITHRVLLLPQEAYVFSGTLRENLRYLRDDVSDDELVHAVRTLSADLLLTGSQGLDRPMSRTTSTAGERQLVALVRGYVSNAHTVIMDEATSNLDAATESAVEAAFRSRPGALIVIAHRLDSATRADEVLFMENGRATHARHDELLSLSPPYAELFRYWERPGRPVTP